MEKNNFPLAGEKRASCNFVDRFLSKTEADKKQKITKPEKPKSEQSPRA